MIEIINNQICCASCDQFKDVSEFRKNRKNVTKEASYSKNCIDCWNHMSKIAHRLNKQYKHLKPDSCQICGVVTNKIELDHCHVTDKFRGFICRSCNRTIGRSGEKVETIDKIISYLKKHNETQS